MAIAGGVIIAVRRHNLDQGSIQGPLHPAHRSPRSFRNAGLQRCSCASWHAGQIKLSVDLTGSQSLAEMQGRIQKAAENAAPGAWLTGGGWDHTLWASKTLPTKSDIDAVSGGHPAFLVRVDGHIAIANSAALAAAGITRTTPDPQGGKIDRDANGDATGIIRETAQASSKRRFRHPPPSSASRAICSRSKMPCLTALHPSRTTPTGRTFCL